jgi:hypothetical protein
MRPVLVAVDEGFRDRRLRSWKVWKFLVETYSRLNFQWNDSM